MAWLDSATKTKLTKTILAMSNIRDGGTIIMGVREVANGTFEMAGVSPEHDGQLVYDDIADWVASHADPYVRFSMERLDCDRMRFVVFKVDEFEDMPVLCKKAFNGELKNGALYVRSRRKPETVEVDNSTDMRDILELAVDKRLREFSRRLSLVVPTAAQPNQTDDENYDREAGDNP